MSKFWHQQIIEGIPLVIYTGSDIYDDQLQSVQIELEPKNTSDISAIPSILGEKEVIKNVVYIKNYDKLRKYLADTIDEVYYDTWLTQTINLEFWRIFFKDLKLDYMEPTKYFKFPIWKTYKIIETPYYNIVSMVPDNIQYIRDELEINPQNWYRDIDEIIKKNKYNSFVYKFVLFLGPEDSEYEYNYITINTFYAEISDPECLITDCDDELSIVKINKLYKKLLAGKAKVYIVHKYFLNN